jgi:hypothetical protein
VLVLLHRHRRRFGRLLASVLTLGWLTLALQPCASAQEAMVAPVSAQAESHMHRHADHHGEMGSHEKGAPVAVDEEAPCSPGGDCPVFNAVDEQASTKPADPFDVPLKAAPVLLSSWLIPSRSLTNSTARVDMVARTSVPVSPILEFRVLRI